MQLKDKLKLLRKQRTVTQIQVANSCKIAERAYQRIEAGTKPSYDTLIALADYFDVSLDYLVGRTDNPEINR